MHRFYVEKANLNQSSLSISDRHEIHHINDVLRLKAGDEVSIFNGQNQEALCVIDTVKETVVAFKVKSVKQSTKNAQPLILACAVPKKSKFEFIIEKCTELGIDAIIPLRTKRTEVIFSKEKIFLKQQRFQKVAINASKQCGRRNVPQIHAMTDLKDLFALIPKDSVVCIASLIGQSMALKEVLKEVTQDKAIVILIGPEGDFTGDEVAFAIAQGAQLISLGSTVLKVDTAAMTSVAFCRFFLYN